MRKELRSAAETLAAVEVLTAVLLARERRSAAETSATVEVLTAVLLARERRSAAETLAAVEVLTAVLLDLDEGGILRFFTGRTPFHTSNMSRPISGSQSTLLATAIAALWRPAYLPSTNCSSSSFAV
jgi:hypothetical protein